jgi:hypothetical protein
MSVRACVACAWNQDEEALSLDVRVATRSPTAAARSAKTASSGKPIPKASIVAPSVQPATMTKRNVTIPRTGCGSLQITGGIVSWRLLGNHGSRL